MRELRPQPSRMQSTIFALWETKIGAGIDEPIIDETITEEPITEETITEETMVEFAKRCQKKRATCP